MYKDYLKELREKVFEAPESTPTNRSRGLIQARVDSKPLDKPQITPYADWLRTISLMASDLKTETSSSSEGGFAQGLTNTLDFDKVVGKITGKSPDPVENVPEENREAFIRRRSDGPSYYAPRESKADTFKDLIDTHEGGGDYDTLFSFSNRDGGRFAGVKVSEMTIGELKAFANGDYGAWSKEKLGYKATPMGRYQFVGATLSDVAKQMGLSDDTVFDQQTQDAMFDFWVGKTIARGKTVDEKVDLLRGQWEGFKNVKRSTLADLVVKYGA